MSASYDDIPVGWMVKIPLDLLEVEFLPRDHPHRRRVEEERSAADAEWAKRPALAGSLRDAVVVLDPGHGGRDIGTEKHGLWEHDYVYDIAVRVKRRLEESGARVHMTLVDEETGTLPSEGDDLRRNQQGTIRTTPPFLPKEAGDVTIGVHLRWYLANAILRREVRAGVDPSRVVFLSIHADARHASLRGAMVYVPGGPFHAKGPWGHPLGMISTPDPTKTNGCQQA